MKFSINHKLLRWLRIIHRDLGFLMVGISVVYAISGILLNHMNGKDPAFKTIETTIKIDTNLTNEELQVYWSDKKLPEIKKILPIDENHRRLMLVGGIGVYNSATGIVDYETHKRNAFVYWINKLHYSKVKGWNIMADLFAISLLFFAVSGLLMVKGKKGIAGSGKWYLLLGILIPILYVLFT